MEVNTCGVTLVVYIRIKGRFCFKAYLLIKLQLSQELSIAHELMCRKLCSQCGAQCALENDYQADRQETLLSRKVFKTGFKEATPHLKYFPGSAACRGGAGE